MDTSATHNRQNHGSVKSYITGLLLSVILTVIPFGLVMAGTFSKTFVVITIAVMAAIQIMLQLTLFMHLNLRTREGRDSGSFMFFTGLY
jgi:cytochrome o ubiquinol oxidase operon protein cyoD